MKILMSAAAVVFSVLLFIFPQFSVSGSVEGVRLCIDVLLPSLFPFMIISSFISLCGAADFLSLLFIPVTRLLNLPDKTAAVWLSSFTGGFPSGAHSICSLYRLSAVSKQQAEQLISCCVCSGPSFLILAVGSQMLGSAKTGILLFLSQIISVIIITAIFCRQGKQNGSAAPFKYLSFDKALVSAVSDSAFSLINIFACVLFFSVLTYVLNGNMPFSRFIVSFLEVTLGCRQAAILKNGLSVLFIAFLTGFGGVSVCFQILSLARDHGLSPARFWLIRIINGVLCASVFKLLTLLFPACSPVFSHSLKQTATVIWSVDRMLGGICLASMLLLSLQKLDFDIKT